MSPKRVHPIPRLWLAMLALVALAASSWLWSTTRGATGAASSHRPLDQRPTATLPPSLTLYVIGKVDIAGGRSEDCPGCNLYLSSADLEYWDEHPLGEMRYRVLDASGQVLAVQSSQPDGRTIIDVRRPHPGEVYTLELLAPPSGFALCPNNPHIRRFEASTLPTWQEEFFFWAGCPRGSAPLTPVPLPSSTQGPPATPWPSASPTPSATTTASATSTDPLPPPPSETPRTTPTDTVVPTEVPPTTSPTPQPTATITPSPTVVRAVLATATAMALPPLVPAQGGRLQMDRVGLLPDPDDTEFAGGCAQDAAVLGDRLLLACGGLIQLSHEGDRPPKALRAQAFPQNFRAFAMAKDRVFALFEDGRVWGVVEGEGGDLRFLDTEFPARMALSVGDTLVTMIGHSSNPFGGGFDFLSIDPDSLVLQALVRIAEPNLMREPIVDAVAERFYLWAYTVDWNEVDLRDPSAPRSLRRLQFPHKHVAIRDQIAYVPQHTRGFGDATWAMEIRDLRTDPPSHMASLDLDELYVPGPSSLELQDIEVYEDTVFLALRGGKVLRADVSDPSRPRLLTPLYFDGKDLRFVRLADRLGLLIDRWDLAYLDGDAGTMLPVESIWSPKGFSAPHQDLQVSGQDLYVSQFHPSSLGERADYLHYSLTDPTEPRPGGRMRVYGEPSLGRSENPDEIYALAQDNLALHIYDVSNPRVKPLVWKWCAGGACPAPPEEEPFVSLAGQGDIVLAQREDGSLILLNRQASPYQQWEGRWRFEGLEPGRMLVLGQRLLLMQEDAPPFGIDISEPFQPRPIGPIHGLPQGVTDWTRRGSQTALAGGDIVAVVDVRAPDRLDVPARATFDGPVRDLASTDERLFVLLERRLWAFGWNSGGELDAIGWLPVAAGGELAAYGDWVYWTHPGRADIEILGNLQPAPAEEPRAYLPVLTTRR